MLNAEAGAARRNSQNTVQTAQTQQNNPFNSHSQSHEAFLGNFVDQSVFRETEIAPMDQMAAIAMEENAN